MFGTYLSNRKQVTFSSLFIPSLSFSAQKQLKAKSRFTLLLVQALAACRFTSVGLYFFFFTTTSAFAIFALLIMSSCYVLSTAIVACMLSFAGRNALTPHPEMSQLQQKIQAEGRALQTQSPDDCAEFCVYIYIYIYIFFFF